ncbi:MAG TPA: phosphoribosyl-AMP cyclohydrolase [Dehalococcoidia bacterium]|nr:phosphoribosyl-AMP cyclohydrolase [Dehalococcoidia bacterium]
MQWDKDGLAPAIIQDDASGDVLMLGYMNEESLAKTRETGQVWFWSRSRGELWHKGETSGDYLAVKALAVDCDQDTLLVRVEMLGSGTCHTGDRSCFDRGWT